MLTAQDKLNQVLSSWTELLSGWSADGSLAETAAHVLDLDGDNTTEGADAVLQSYTSQWSLGGFEELPPIVLLSNEEINGARGAYAASTETIYLNEDWLLTAQEEKIIAVLTEELGAFLDDQLNTVDTQGDEGALFSAELLGVELSDAEVSAIQAETDTITISVDGEKIYAEANTQVNGALWVDGKKRYRLYDADKGKYRLLTSSKGKTYRDSSSAAWDAVYAKQNKKGKFKVLLDGEGKKEGKAQLWNADRKGEIVSKSRWFGSGAKLRKWEKKSGLELDSRDQPESNDQLGTTTDPITGNRFFSASTIAGAYLSTFIDISSYDLESRLFDGDIATINALETFELKVEFNDTYFSMASAIKPENPPNDNYNPVRTIFKGNFEYDGDELIGGSINEYIQVSGDPSDPNVGLSYGDYGRFIAPIDFLQLKNDPFDYQDNINPIDSFTWDPVFKYGDDSVGTFETVTSRFDNGGFFPDGWWSESIEQIDVLI